MFENLALGIPEIAGIIGGVVLLLAIAVWMWMRRISRRDQELLRQMEPLLDELWSPMRYLADLRSVWPDLTEVQRADIESSTVYKDRFHQKKAEVAIEQIRFLARGIRSVRHWRLRAVILSFLRSWEEQEPDNLKVLSSMVRRPVRRD